VKFGIIPAYGAASVETGDYATLVARLAEELGFESIWPVEHVVMAAEYKSRYPYDPSGRMPIERAAIPDPLTWLAWVAAVTRHLKLGTAVVILPQRNPLVLAKTVASLDRLSDGRVLLGVGLGWMREEAEAVGVSFDDRGARADEYIEAMRALWTQPVASYRGEHISFENVSCNPLPARPGGVPIYIGGHTPAAARRAGRLGDGFLPLAAGLEEILRLREIMQESARKAGREPGEIEISCVGPPNPEIAKAYAEAGIARMIVPSLEADIEATKRKLGEFSAKVMSALA